MRRTATAEKLSPRGVEKRSVLSPNGYPVLTAVRGDGRILDEVELRPDMNAWVVIAELRAKLDVADPVPQLRLVRPRFPMSPPNMLGLCKIGLRIQARGF